MKKIISSKWEIPNKISLVSGIILLIVMTVFFIPTSKAQTDFSENISLEGGSVIPENGVWGQNFNFKIICENLDDTTSVDVSINLHIDEITLNMVESIDIGEDNAENETQYTVDWKPKKESIGSHFYYFTLESNSKENLRYPENGQFEGPVVNRRSPQFIDFNLYRKDNSLFFSGTLVDNRNSEGLPHKTVEIYKVLKGKSKLLKKIQTGGDGSFKGRISGFRADGVFRFESRLGSDNFYKSGGSDPEFITSIDRFDLAVPSIALFLTLFFGALLFFSVEEDYPILILIWGISLSVIFFVLLTKIFSGFLVGVMIGFLLDRYISNWYKILKIGAKGGIIASAVFSFVNFFNLAILNRSIHVQHSYNQMAFMLDHFLASLLLAAVLLGAGMSLGSLLGYIMKRFISNF